MPSELYAGIRTHNFHIAVRRINNLVTPHTSAEKIANIRPGSFIVSVTTFLFRYRSLKKNVAEILYIP